LRGSVSVRRACNAPGELRFDSLACLHLCMPWDFWLIFLILGVVLPWRGRHRMQHFMALPEASGRERIKLYLTTILFQWSLAAIVCWRVVARGITVRELGVTPGRTPGVFVVAFAGAVLIAAAHWMNMRRMGSSKHPAAEKLRAMGARLFPRTSTELIFYVLLALTAGCCEEFLFRGFVIAALFHLSLSKWIVIPLSAAMFGVAHLYQGKGGSVGTALLGILFAAVRIAYHSLFPVVLWHAVLDVVAGIAGTRYLVRRESAMEAVEQIQ
jgi:membrane protease YdiL (CAAX protease family)